MKKTIIFFFLLVVLFYVNYMFYESQITEVFLSGKVVAFNLENIKTNTINTKTINTSSQTVGTMTFIKQNGNFAALGHSISDDEVLEGECYNIEFETIQKGTTEKPGTIVAHIDKDSEIGHLSKQSYCGLFGSVDTVDTHDLQKIQTENRYNITKGTAYLLIDFDGSGMKQYEIEITGINFFSFTKNLKISVKSPELIEKTGGIVQGMSGSPIIQNGKLIGAVNCVNVNNPLEAYGVFVDKLI